jgi:flagellar biosynthesis protein FlhF
MNVKKFSASSSRDALRQVREALGPDAVILSNRNINGLVEILALASEDMSSLASPVVEKETLAAQVALPAQEATMLSAFAKRRMETDQAAGLAGALEQSQQARNARPPEPAPQISVLREMAEMMNELRSMRTMMESQFSELSWSSQQKREPVKATILRELLAAGFSASLSRYLVENLPAGGTAAAGMIWIKTVLARNITAVSDESAMLEQGGVCVGWSDRRRQDHHDGQAGRALRDASWSRQAGADYDRWLSDWRLRAIAHLRKNPRCDGAFGQG